MLAFVLEYDCQKVAGDMTQHDAMAMDDMCHISWVMGSWALIGYGIWDQRFQIGIEILDSYRD
jgi:hypothetical protein